MLRAITVVTLALVVTNSLAQEGIYYRYSPDGCLEDGGTVVPVIGVVTSTPADPFDPDATDGCGKAISIDGANVPPDTPIDLDPGNTNPDPVCLRIEASGTIKMSGYSVLTHVSMSDPFGGSATTSFCFPGDETRGCNLPDSEDPTTFVPFPTASAGLLGFASQAALEGRVKRFTGNKYEGTIYTKDTGYITADGFAGQVLLVVGGLGDLEGATGRIGVAGQEVGGNAIYTGHVCIDPELEDEK